MQDTITSPGSINGRNSIFGIPGDRSFSGQRGDHFDAGNPASLSLSNGTFSLKFQADRIDGARTLFSKDARGYEEGGHLTARIVNGHLEVRQQSQTESETLRFKDIKIEPNSAYHLAVSFGDDGLKIYLNGQLAAAEPEFKQGIATNEETLVIGASTMYRSNPDSRLHDQFDGTISDVMVFDEQLPPTDVAGLAGKVSATFEADALASMSIDDLMPAFSQMHHASDVLKALAAQYEINHQGAPVANVAIQQGTDGADSLSGTEAAEAIDGGLGNDTVSGGAENDTVQGGYGNDEISGGDGNDVLDGGHGEDIVDGGDGDDLLISQADGREGAIAFDPDRDEADPLNELTNGKLYPDQPIPADDVFIGGKGADTFYFQTLINAKKRYIEEHTNDDGTIRWHGVAGENDKLHDHWVDVIGDDVIMDFDREEGDKIVIEGHTTEIGGISYGDANGDGVVDHSVIQLYSDQGNGGGAHNDDLLGTIKVYGDLVKETDITHTSKPAYGIVKTIDRLDEALAPVAVSDDRGAIAPPADLPNQAEFGQVHGMSPVFGIAGATEFSGERNDYLETGHSAALEIANGTIALTFNADSVSGHRTLFSKDGNGFDDGGHLTAWIKNGSLYVRQQSTDKSEYLKVPDLSISAGEPHHLSVSFGEDGLKIYFDGTLVAAEPEFKQGLETNVRSFVVGASGAYRKDDAQTPHNPFDGTISDVMVFDNQLDSVDVAGLAGKVSQLFEANALLELDVEDLMPAFAQAHHGSDVLKALATAYGFNHDGRQKENFGLQQGTDQAETLAGTDQADAISAGLGDDTVSGGAENDTVQGGYGNDEISGGDGNDVLDGGHGEDIVDGGDGDDLLISQADGREGAIAFDPNRDEADPLNELTNGKLYPDQPIPADDVFIGGKGADTFYFQTLINAKKRYIEKHTNDDGTIRWHGVAGENDKLHDHWVDVIGDDVIMDFDREEGDKIVIEGHTTEIGGISYGDANGDGVVDHSVIQLYSDQGNGGGAHNDDLLGTIKVYGDLVKETDITHTSKPAYGIVKTIDRLDEALAPIAVSDDRGPAAPPADLPNQTGFGLVNGKSPVFGVAGATMFSGDRGDYLETGHSTALELPNGTIALSFTADTVSGHRALFSKDGNGFDQGGHLTAWLKNGTLFVRQQSADKSEYLKVPDVAIAIGEMHHLAVSFGEDGLKVYLDGVFVAAEPEFKQGLEANERSFVIGASGAYRKDDAQTAHNQFDGTISDVMVFDTQIQPVDVAALAGQVDAGFEMTALLALSVEELMPAFAQLHHGSDALKALATAYGFHHDGSLMADVALEQGTDEADAISGTAQADAIDGGLGNDTVSGGAENDTVQGGYGNDEISGGDGNDVLDGGHGEDIVDGGDGDDLLISQADGREGAIAFDPNRDEADPLNELTNGKLYPDQPIPADDVFIGGKGADTFYFQTLINAKKRYIEEHTNDDGTIRWHGVAGENDKLHDHWVDVIGDDVIMDFDREEGDRIVIEGHTTEIGGISYGDANGDGIVDHSVIQLYSDQGNGGGAHNDDLLGTIKVYGDLVKETDITHTSKPAYGIVKTIDRLDEALAPVAVSQDRGPIAPPADLPNASGVGAVNGLSPVFAIAGNHEFAGGKDDYLQTGHTDSFDIAKGTLALTFNADTISGTHALFSKDGSGYDEGGHITAWIKNGRLVVRQQSESKSEYLQVPDVRLAANQTYHLAVAFGEDGLKIYLNGEFVAAEPEFKQGLDGNERSLVIGASGHHRRDDAQTPREQFDGTISDVMVFDTQIQPADVAALAGQVDAGFEMTALLALSVEELMPAFAQLHHGSDALKALATAYGFHHNGSLMADVALEQGTDEADAISGTAQADAIDGGLGNDTVSGGAENDTVQGGYGNDEISGGDGNDVLDGGHGEDIVDGGDGDDLLISQADGREGAIAFDPNRDEADPLNELTNGKLYPDQPIPADDVFIGGKGADTFYFQTLINAKKRYIEEHTNDDGTIRWHGVAGENNKLHDHWVDIIGDDVIMDFDREEGDRIVIEGHTTEIGGITYGDDNSDGIVDHSMIQLYSDQGNGGGAHNDDLLGTIKVYGDLVKESDITHTSKPAYGIVKTIDLLDEALAPTAVSEDLAPVSAPADLPIVEAPENANPVFGIAGSIEFSGDCDDHFAQVHTSALDLAEGTIAFSFQADKITGRDALFSKDASGNGDGGHLTAFVEQDGDLKVRFQNETGEKYLVARNVVEAGVEHDFGFTFGQNGAHLYLDGQEVAADITFTENWQDNEEVLLIGANGWASQSGEVGRPSNHFDGIIQDFVVLDSQLNAQEVSELPQFADDQIF